MKTNPLSFYRLVFLSMFGKLINKVVKSQIDKTFPKKIGEYNFIKPFYKDGDLQPFYTYGIYRSKSGKKAFAKMWTGSFKNYAYYSLLNEITIYKLVNRVLRRSKEHIPTHLKKVTIPAFIHFKETNHSLIILIEFINASNAESLNTQEKVSVYFKAVDFYQFVSEQLTKSEKLLLSKRTAKNYIMLYPFILLKAMVNYPQYIVELLKSIPGFIKSIPYLLKNNQLVLTQRDLVFKNILFHNNKIVLIDLEMCLMTSPVVEYANTLRRVSRNKSLFKSFLKEVHKKFSGNTYKQELRGLASNLTIHSLTEMNLPSDYLNKEINFLRILNKGELL